MFKKMKQWARQIKRNIMALYLVMKRKDIAWYKKAYIGLIVSYALSPIDLIPDFIPILGYLDDVIILPLMILLAIKMIPKETLEVCRIEADERFKNKRPKSMVAGIIIIIIWITLITLAGYYTYIYFIN